jgi:hypothetical protein
LGYSSKKWAIEFQIINPQTKQNYMNIPKFGKSKCFWGKSPASFASFACKTLKTSCKTCFEEEKPRSDELFSVNGEND